MNETLVFGQAPTVSPITPDEFNGLVESRVAPLSEYFDTMATEGFKHSLPGAMLDAALLPDDDITGRRDPEKVAEFLAKNRRYPSSYDEVISVMERTPVPTMSEEDWKASEFYRKEIPFDGRMTEARARYKAQEFDASQYRAWIRNNEPWGVGQMAAAVAGSVIGAAPDPTNYIPVFGQAFRIANAGRIATIMARAGIGAAENMAITALADPLIASSRRQFGEDVTFADQLMDVALAGLFGGVVGGGAGALHLRGERLADREPATVSRALQTVGVGADQLANDLPIDVAGPYRRALLEGTSLERRPVIPEIERARIEAGSLERSGLPSSAVPVSDLRASGLNAPAFTDRLDIPTTRQNGEPAVYPADLVGFKSEINRAVKAAAAEDRTLELRDMPDGRKELVETSKVEWLDQYPDEKTAQANLNRMTPVERKGVDVVPVETSARGKGFALIRGATPSQVTALRANPALAERMVQAGRPAEVAAPNGVAAPARETLDQAMAATASRAKTAAAPRSIDAVAQDVPLWSPERVAKADASVGKAETLVGSGFKEKAAEHGLDENGEFDEMAEIRRLEGKSEEPKETAKKPAELPFNRVKEAEVPDKPGLQPLAVGGDGKLYVLDKRHEDAIPELLEGAGLDPFGPWGGYLADNQIALVTRYTPADGVGRSSIGINVYEGGITPAQVSALQRFVKRYGEDADVKVALFGRDAGYGDDAIRYMDGAQSLRELATGKPAAPRGPNLLTKDEQAALRDADHAVAKADAYAKAYQAAASCLMKAAE